MADPQAKPPVPDGAEASLPGTLAALTALAPEAGMVDLDPALFGRALGAAALSAARHPESAARAGLRCALDLARTSLAAASRAAGHSVAGPMPHDAADRRFSDPAWEDNAAFFALRQSYLVLRRLVRGSARGRGAGHRDAREGCIRGRAARRRAGADQPSPDQPGGAQAGVRDRRAERRCRLPQLHRRHPSQRWPAASGRRQSLPAWREHGGHAEQGRLPQ